MNQKIYWSLITHRDWNLYLAATKNGLCFVGSFNHSLNELSEWVIKRFRDVVLIENNEFLRGYAVEMIEYLEGDRRQFSMPMDFHGTQFQLKVWNALNNIQYGETKTYKDIADMINNPKAIRAVGSAIGKNPLLITIPCHRVIGKNGTLTGYRGGLDMKMMLLKMEQHQQSI